MSIGAQKELGEIGENDAAGFERFFRAQWPKLRRALISWTSDRFLSEDVAQEVMLRLREYWGRYDKPERLMYRIARQRLYRRRVLGADLGVEINESLNHIGSYSSDMVEVEQRLDLLAMLEDLPRRQRDVIVLSVVYDLDSEAVSERLGISPSSVKTHKSRALIALKRAYVRERGTRV